jgi:hypothetical protein
MVVGTCQRLINVPNDANGTRACGRWIRREEALKEGVGGGGFVWCEADVGTIEHHEKQNPVCRIGLALSHVRYAMRVDGE